MEDIISFKSASRWKVFSTWYVMVGVEPAPEFQVCKQMEGLFDKNYS